MTTATIADLTNAYTTGPILDLAHMSTRPSAVTEALEELAEVVAEEQDENGELVRGALSEERITRYERAALDAAREAGIDVDDDQ